METGWAVIGTPDDAVAQIERLQRQSGGFGCFLQLAHNWADWDQTRRSYELWARYVTPRLRNASANREASHAWTRDHQSEFVGAAADAAQKMFMKHAEEEAAKAGRSDVKR